MLSRFTNWLMGEEAVERRESQPFTDAFIAALTLTAAGSSPGNPSALGALEVASGFYARAFAAAVVSPKNNFTRSLTAPVLALMARDMIRRGESIHLIELDGAGVRLTPAGSWDIQGGADPRSWWVRCDLFGPSGNVTRFVPHEAVIHCRYAVDPGRPYIGISPLSWASATATLASNLELRLGEEAGAPVGAILPVPVGTKRDEMSADLAAMKGHSTLAETTQDGGGDPTQRPSKDWAQQRIGADPPTALGALREQSEMSVLAACGVSPSLVSPKDGTAQRESYRRFLFGSVLPLARLVEVELSEKLGQDVSLNFDSLSASDLTGRARAFASLVKGGMDISRAAGLAGLLSEDD